MSGYDGYSDAQLVAACCQGEDAAWNALVSRYERLVYTIPLRYGLPRAEAEDVFQAVWLTLLEKVTELEQPDRVSAWLVTTARRASWDRRRGGEHERTIAVDPELLAGNPHPHNNNEPQEMLEDPEQIVERFQRQQRLEEAFARLGGRCRRLLHYLYRDPTTPSYDDIAESLDMAVGSVGPTRARCLKKLRELLEEETE